MSEEHGRTSAIRMIATDVVQQQSRVCAETMNGIQKDLIELTRVVNKISDKWDASIPLLIVDVAVLKTRWQLFGIVGTVFGVVGTVVGILIAVFK